MNDVSVSYDDNNGSQPLKIEEMNNGYDNDNMNSNSNNNDDHDNNINQNENENGNSNPADGRQ